MLAISSFIGVLLIFGVIVGFLFRSKIPIGYQSLFQDKAKVTTLLFAGLFLALSNSLFFYSRFGHQYYLVYPTGGWSTVFTSGFKFRWFATIQEWQKEIDIKVVGDGESTEGIEGVIPDKVTFVNSGKTEQIPGIGITFIDRVAAAVQISVRMKMPEDPETFRALAESFRNPSNLINNTLIPTIKEQVSNTGYMFAAQDYISGAATDFRQAIDDQLKYGGFSTERREYSDTIYASIQIAGQRTIKEINTRYKIIRKTDQDGKLIRLPHEITKNNVLVTQVIVDEVYAEPAFKNRLEAQRDISQKRIEMEKIETAKAEQQRILAEGERDKAKERMDQEREQVKQLIAIETQLKQESTKKQLAEIALQTARLEAEQNLVRERAQAEANRLKVAAGLTPQERAQIQKETAIGVAEKLSDMKLPQVYIEGGGKDGKNNIGLIESLIGAEMAKSMLPALKDDK
jgi:hypothetical protein